MLIGAAVGLGSIAFSTFLIVGFALHNTTEGIAIAAPMSRGKEVVGKAMILKLAALGLIAGSPAIFGAWIGGFVYSPFTSVIFLAVGAGAIFPSNCCNYEMDYEKKVTKIFLVPAVGIWNCCRNVSDVSN